MTRKETVMLAGVIYPHYMGGFGQLEDLRAEAAKGKRGIRSLPTCRASSCPTARHVAATVSLPIVFGFAGAATSIVTSSLSLVSIRINLWIENGRNCQFRNFGNL